jgi:hypothetical protein
VGDPPAWFIGVSAGLRFESLEPRRFSKPERYGFGSRRQRPNARGEESSDEPFSTGPIYGWPPILFGGSPGSRTLHLGMKSRG